jgi:hypothetical protein
MNTPTHSIRLPLTGPWRAVSVWLLLLFVQWNVQAQVRISGNLNNFDVRYPGTQPDDVEVVLYGDGLKASDVVSTWNTSIALGDPPVGLGWGRAESITESTNNDPTSLAFGLDCVVIRWRGERRPDLIGRMVHLGVHLRPGVAPAHQELWWTLDGRRIGRPCDPHVSWICTRLNWLVCVANPTPSPIYVYGCRWFQPGTNAPNPTLNQLTLGVNPASFGGTWTSVPTPARVVCIPPWCRIYFRVPIVRWRPIIFQVAARNVGEDILPLPFQPGQPVFPTVDDFREQGVEGGLGTMAILTSRSTQEFPGDINGDGVVGVPDFNELRLDFNRRSLDLDVPSVEGLRDSK